FLFSQLFWKDKWYKAHYTFFALPLVNQDKWSFAVRLMLSSSIPFHVGTILPRGIIFCPSCNKKREACFMPIFIIPHKHRSIQLFLIIFSKEAILICSQFSSLPFALTTGISN